MNKNNTWLRLSVCLCFLGFGVTHASPKLSEYLYESSISNIQIQEPTRVKIEVPPKLQSYFSKDFDNFVLLDSDNNKIPFDLFDTKENQVDQFFDVSTSFLSPEVNPEYLTDGDVFTQFGFPNTGEVSWLSLKLPQPLFLHQIQLDPLPDAQIKSVTIQAGKDHQSLKTISRSSERNPRVLNLKNENQASAVKLYFEGPAIGFSDILFLQAPQVDLYFEAIPGNNYRLLIGPGVDHIQYQSRLSEPQNIEKTVFFSDPYFSPLASEDFDQDTINNQKDNCPALSNKNQLDSDQDGIGDLCDNAPKTKNYGQQDFDKDQVGDVIDNCKTTPNEDQSDQDNDGIGDACDLRNHQNTSLDQITIHSKKYGTSVIGVILLLLVIFLFFSRRKY